MLAAPKTEEVQSESKFLDEALDLSRQFVTLRDHLNQARREHAELLAQRESALYRGEDLLPEIRKRYEMIEELPSRIAQLEEQARWIIQQGVNTLNEKNSYRAGQEYIRLRDKMRQVVEQFRAAWAPIQAELTNAAALGGPLTEPYNARLAEIHGVLGGGFPRVLYTHLPLPTIDAELLKRDGLLAALDRWLITLRP